MEEVVHIRSNKMQDAQCPTIRNESSIARNSIAIKQRAQLHLRNIQTSMDVLDVEVHIRWMYNNAIEIRLGCWVSCGYIRTETWYNWEEITYPLPQFAIENIRVSAGGSARRVSFSLTWARQ